MGQSAPGGTRKNRHRLKTALFQNKTLLFLKLGILSSKFSFILNKIFKYYMVSHKFVILALLSFLLRSQYQMVLTLFWSADEPFIKESSILAA